MIPTPETSEGPLLRRRIRRASAASREFGIIFAFVALFVALALSSPNFLTSANLLNILTQSAPVGIIACGGTLVIIAGGFDLSVGAIYALSGVIAAEVANRVDPIAGLLVGVVAGAALGAINGGIVSGLRMNTFIATLASGYVFRGIATLMTGGFLVSVADPSFSILNSEHEMLGVRNGILLFALVVLITSVLLDRTVFGRYIFAIGGNKEAARLSGVRVEMVRIMTFTISGLCAGLAGMIAASEVSTGQANGGVGLELAAIAAIVVGGTTLTGGFGSIWRTVMGVLLVAMIGNGFNLLNIDPFYQSVVQGLIIILAVWFDGWSRRRGAGSELQSTSTKNSAKNAKPVQ